MTLSHHCLVLPWSLSMDAAVIPVGVGGAAWDWGFTAAGPSEQLICRTWFTLVILSSTGLSHLHHTGVRWVQGESGCCYLGCISSLRVGAARARWEDRSLPILPAAGGCWSLLCFSKSSSCPCPQRAGAWGRLPGAGAAVLALPDKDQADTTDGKRLPVLNRGSPGHDAAPLCWARPGHQAAPQPCSAGAPVAQHPGPSCSGQ